MLKIISGFFAGIIVVAILAWQFAGGLMIQEHPSPFGLQETVARIQHNIQDAGWDLSGLRSPSNTVRKMGANVPNVLLIEACKPDYSKPILKDDDTRILSILMPCSITVYEKGDKIYIGLMNTALMGRLFGPMVTEVMAQVAADQKKFITFDASKPAPPLIRPKSNGGSGGNGKGGIQDLGGC